jgi:hypothetical protein
MKQILIPIFLFILSGCTEPTIDSQDIVTSNNFQEPKFPSYYNYVEIELMAIHYHELQDDNVHGHHEQLKHYGKSYLVYCDLKNR